MSKSEREARLQRAKILGRIAYRELRSSDIEGVLTYDGEEKYLRLFEEGELTAELVEPFRPYALAIEFSRIQICVTGRKVFEISWDRVGHFRVLLFEPGDWERTLLDLPEPIPL